MTAHDFCIWLHGYFELSDSNELTEAQIKSIRAHLESVFVKENPSVGDYEEIEEGQDKPEDSLEDILKEIEKLKKQDTTNPWILPPSQPQPLHPYDRGPQWPNPSKPYPGHGDIYCSTVKEKQMGMNPSIGSDKPTAGLS